MRLRSAFLHDLPTRRTQLPRFLVEVNVTPCVTSVGWGLDLRFSATDFLGYRDGNEMI
jgi:hypothetical protein